jgi:hypothetical protein
VWCKCNREALIKRGRWPTRGCCAIKNVPCKGRWNISHSTTTVLRGRLPDNWGSILGSGRVISVLRVQTGAVAASCSAGRRSKA